MAVICYVGVSLSVPEGASATPVEVHLTSGHGAVADSLTAAGCLVRSPTAAERSSLGPALDHLTAILEHDSLGQLAQRRFVVAHQGRWAEASLPDLARQLRSLGRVSLFVFDHRTDGAPCPLIGSDEEANALAEVGGRSIALSAGYLRILSQEGPVRRTRRLAGTLLHELAHVLGYEHPRTGVGGSRYNATVPAWLGCLAAAWPDARWAMSHCHRDALVRDVPWQGASEVAAAGAGAHGRHDAPVDVRIRVVSDSTPASGDHRH